MSAEAVTGPATGPQIRPAATVVLLRDGSEGVETWLLQRVSAMPFAPGMTVFPGGRVDASDADPDVPRSGADVWAERWGIDPDLARAVAVAAARETFEETGVLLARPAVTASPVTRRAVERHEQTFAAVLRELGAAVDLDAMRPWTRWVTPELDTRRYDTFFLVAALPDGARADADTPEAAAAEWVPIRRALAEADSGQRLMLPPTSVTLRAIAPLPDVAAVLAAAEAQDLTAVRPVMRRGPAGVEIVLADGTVLPVPAAAAPPAPASRD